MSNLTKLTPKLHVRESLNGERTYIYWCPGCGHAHSVPTPRWNFNQDFNAPSFTPSVRHFYEHPETKQQETTCHYHVMAGKIVYCGDCKHALNGQTVDMAPIPDDYGT